MTGQTKPQTNMAALDSKSHNTLTFPPLTFTRLIALTCLQLHTHHCAGFISLVLLQPHSEVIAQVPVCSAITKPLFMLIAF